MKSILISIRPQWVKKIASGEKTIEVRKTRPKIKTPFKCYIYCTKPSKKYQTICGCMVINTDELYRLPNGKIKHDWSGELMCCNGEYTRDNFLNGKVIGEFICDKVYKIEPIFSFYDSYSGYDDFCDSSSFDDYSIDNERLKKTCLTRQELYVYGKGEAIYGWHISNLKIYDKPKELSEFTPVCKIGKDLCKMCCFYEETFGGCCRVFTRPPQSWCYVEEVEQ